MTFCLVKHFSLFIVSYQLAPFSTSFHFWLFTFHLISLSRRFFLLVIFVFKNDHIQFSAARKIFFLCSIVWSITLFHVLCMLTINTAEKISVSDSSALNDSGACKFFNLLTYLLKVYTVSQKSSPFLFLWLYGQTSDSCLCLTICTL